MCHGGGGGLRVGRRWRRAAAVAWPALGRVRLQWLVELLRRLQRLVVLLHILEWWLVRWVVLKGLLLLLLLLLMLVLYRLVLVLWEGRIFACIPHAVALIRALFLVHVPLEIRRSKQPLDGVAALVLAEQLTLSNARAVAQDVANFEARRRSVVRVASHPRVPSVNAWRRAALAGLRNSFL